MANQIVSRSGAAFSKDPRIILMDYIKFGWGVGNITPPAVESVRFDTKFGAQALTMQNAIVVEKMPAMMKPQTLGGSRSEYIDTYRVQIYCRGHSAINNKYTMEQEIQRIINADPDAIQTVNNTATGIDWAWIDEFVEIPVASDAKVGASVSPSLPATAARSAAIVRLYYQKEAA